MEKIPKESEGNGNYYLMISQIVVTFWIEVTNNITWFLIMVYKQLQIYRIGKSRIKNISSDVDRQSIMHKYSYKSYTKCISNLRMSRRCFTKLCDMFYTLGGLKTSRFQHSREIISKIVSRVCNVVIRLHPHLLKKPKTITENSTNQRWKWFKNCLGDLDGSYIKCLVPLKDKPKYRKRKNDIATNVLGCVHKICSLSMFYLDGRAQLRMVECFEMPYLGHMD
uniref:Uncharacterized protein n=1 Tax=Lactuca sativa TaxID=4236 RepID=A0A9R1W579_LACSA|nr:hypothetical protein LSAT_V11C300110000 [Lactuca sativa]